MAQVISYLIVAAACLFIGWGLSRAGIKKKFDELKDDLKDKFDEITK